MSEYPRGEFQWVNLEEESMRKIVLLAALAVVVTGCPKKEKKEEPKVTKAGGNVEARSGSKVSGNVSFEDAGDGRLKMTLKLQGLTPGDHGVHIHEKGDCSAADAASAGDHFNPGEHQHGAPGAETHAGDLGNVNAKDDGTAEMTISSAALSLTGKKGVVDRALVIHEKADDMKTQPSGASGARIGCAVIKPMM